MQMRLSVILSLITSISLASCQSIPAETNNNTVTLSEMDNNETTKMDTATFANGCFWCTEAIFESLKGVESAVSGYTGGQTADPDYKQVCNGNTGHAEAVEIVFNPAVISFDELLEAFWTSHDPTTLNRQGNDVGTQYRSAIFYHNEAQKKSAESFKAELNAKKVFPDPIVTEIVAAQKFYPAENYHQQYFELNGNEPYCSYVIRPKLDKFKKVFKEKLKHT